MDAEAGLYFLHPQAAAPGHRLELLVGGETAYPLMLEAIAAARRTVYLESYLWQDDVIGRRFADALIDAASRGAQVCAVRDAVGSYGFAGALESRLRASGVRVAEFHPMSPFGRRPGLAVRDHRKLLVVDGEVAFLGGMNIGDDYAPHTWGGKGFYDVHLRLRGPEVATCDRLFAVAWRYVTGERLGPRQVFPEVESGGARVQVMAFDSRRSRRLIRIHYEHALKRARRSIVILAAYFIPDRGLRAILRKAVGRGVEVRVLLPYANDVAMVQYASRFTYASLLRAGVQLYEWLPGMVHAKAMAVDGRWLAVGSYNLDQRSLRYNWELSAASDDPEACRALEAAFDVAALQAKKITRAEWTKRPLWTRILQWWAYLFRSWL